MTSNKEDYIKVIYSEGGYDRFVSNKAIAQKMGVAPASVSEMLVKLQTDGLIEYRAYHGSRLTKKGMESCIDIVRSHELWEVFLMKCLGYSWWEAHEEAHLLEHVGSEMMIDRLEAFLGYPRTCPHGAVIPRKGQSVPQYSGEQRLLCHLEEGESAVIVRIAENRQLLEYLEERGVQIGMEIKILAKDTFEGPVSFRQGDRTISVSYKAANQIFITQNCREGNSDDSV